MEPASIAPEPSEQDLERLMVRYQAADSEAAALIIDRLSPRLYRFFASQMGSRSDADDMLQEVWLRIHRVRHTYRAGRPFLPWVYAIAHRVRVDGYRKRLRLRREVAVDVVPEPAAAKQPPNSALPPLDELMAALPDSQREVLSMLKIDGLSVDEIARATSSTSGAVKQKLHRAYERLRAFLQQRANASAIPGGTAS